MAFSSSGGTLAIPSPTRAHHADSQIASLRRSMSRSPSKFTLAQAKKSAASTSSLPSQTFESSFNNGRQMPQSPPLGDALSSPAASGTSFHPVPAGAAASSSPTATPSSTLSTAQPNSAPSELFPSTSKVRPTFATPQAQSHSLSSPQIFPHSTQPQQQQQQQQQQPQRTRTPFASAPPKSGVRLSLRSSRLNRNSSKAVPRSRTSPNSPLKRAGLSVSSDSGNSSTPSTTPSTTPPPNLSRGQENNTPSLFFPPPSPVPAQTFDRSNRHSMHLDLSGSNEGLFKLFDSTTPDRLPALTASPLKRSDATMDLGQASLDSPVAKRRSVHGFGGLGMPDNFNIFDQPPSAATASAKNKIDLMDDSHNREYLLTGTFNTIKNVPPSPCLNHHLPRKPGSLRRVTQRIGSGSWGRKIGSQQLFAADGESATPNLRINRARLSDNLDLTQDSPSMPPPAIAGAERPFQPHPLSQAVASSSSKSSVNDEPPSPPIVAPVASLSLPHPANEKINFAQSLPLGARPPMFPDAVQTPKFDFRRPTGIPASTGLVSKMISLPYEESIDAANKLAMPDTPCKKSHNIFATYPPNGSAIKSRRSRPSFQNTNMTPFQSPMAKPSGTFGLDGKQRGKGMSLFSQVRSSRSRSGSYLSLDSDDRKLGDDMGMDDLPPTPTKVTAPLHKQEFCTPRTSHSANHRFAVPTSAIGNGLSRQSSSGGDSCKSRTRSPHNSIVTAGGSPMQRFAGTTSQTLNKASVPVLASPCSQAESIENNAYCTLPSPTQCNPQVHIPNDAKTNTASPLDRFEFNHSTTPRTSQDVGTPDRSSLNINNNGAAHRVSMPPPATPTTRHDSVASLRVITPVNSAAALDVDENLIGMFDKVTEVGSGEFSKVYRVAFFSRQSASTPRLHVTPVKRSQGSSGPNVFAVKRIKMPIGNREHQEKLEEAMILRSLSHENIIRYVNHWEELGNLYIQTEYCEDGSLAGYLEKVGRKGRLDDFRIWKMILEIGSGLQHIHEAGFIHLDLKPANVFLTFDGILKIGDFGLASRWPANSSIEGEGDREYIGPEILQGRYDKPADIYSFGLIVMEMAANVRLPGNGPTWVNLRAGILSDVPTLTWTPDAGAPIVTSLSTDNWGKPRGTPNGNNGRRRLFEPIKPVEDANEKMDVEPRTEPPAFMEDPEHTSSLDRLVYWMLLPNPDERPTIHQVLNVEGSLWVSAHRQLGACVFEGRWGPKNPSQRLAVAVQTPAPTVLDDDDTVMTDV